MTIIIPSKQEPKVSLVIEECERLFPDAQIITCNDRLGKGKGWAVREALKVSNQDIVAFIDGDMDIDPRMLFRMLPFLEDYDIVVGSKVLRGSIWRRILTRLSRFYLHLRFGFDYDTQTGIKLFHRYALLDFKTDGFLFDLELLLRARNKGLQIISVPVEVTDYGKSAKRMKIKNVIRTFVESFKIKGE